MRTLLTLIVLAAAAAPAAAQGQAILPPDVHAVLAHVQRERPGGRQREGVEQTERITRTFRLNGGELHLANIAGDISITRGGGNDVSVEIVKIARGRDEADAREMLTMVELDIAERNNRAEVRTRYPQNTNRRNFNVSVNYTVTAPASVRVRANSISGSITARDIKGDISAESVSGAVRIFNGGRVTAAKSISGNVEVNDTELDGRLDASSASGSIVLRRLKARALEVGSISGDVVLEEVDCSQIEAQSVSGNVKFGGPVARGARFELTSHSGNVTVALGGPSGFEIEATSFSGSIRSDFAFGQQEEQGRRWRRSLRGVHGDGNAVVELTTFSGNIVIAKR